MAQRVDDLGGAGTRGRSSAGTGGGFASAVSSNPIAYGTLAFAAGAIIGAIIPLSKRENELMGEVRDQLVESAQALAQDTVEKVQRVAERAADEVKNVAADEASKQGLVL
jgi:hypothetical protein